MSEERPKFDIADAVNLWNETAARCGWPAIRLMTVQRAGRLRNILAQCGEEGYREAIAKAEASDFLCGRLDRVNDSHANWRFNIDLFLRPSFFVRLLEGAYDNREERKPSSQPSASTMSDEEIQWRARLRGWRESRLWLPGWGPQPGQKGCMVPSRFLDN